MSKKATSVWINILRGAVGGVLGSILWMLCFAKSFGGYEGFFLPLGMMSGSIAAALACAKRLRA
jgi:hypothetical protein